MAAEAKHQAAEILGRSYPMLLPAGLFVMQQVRARLAGWLSGIGISDFQHKVCWPVALLILERRPCVKVYSVHSSHIQGAGGA